MFWNLGSGSRLEDLYWKRREDRSNRLCCRGVEETRSHYHAVRSAERRGNGLARRWRKIGLDVSRRRADQGVVFCWTGTGVTIAANKVPGVRAALCWDAETAKGARMWDDANVLAMSLRSTSPAVAKEILDAWFSSDPVKTGVDAELIERANKLA